MSEEKATAEEGGVTFATYVLGDWNAAMDQFFRKVELASERLDMTADEVRNGLRFGYGDEVLEAWDEWVADA